MQQAAVLELLEELLSHTRAMAEYPSVEVTDLEAHTHSCGMLLDSLKKIANRQPGGLLGANGAGDSQDRRDLADLMARLSRQTRDCRERLGRLLAQTDSELTSLRLQKRQAHAYGEQA